MSNLLLLYLIINLIIITYIIMGGVIGLWNFKFNIIWYDLWVGFYFDQKQNIMYYTPFPCCVFIIR